MFIPGLQLSELFYQEAVRPILDSDFSNIKYSAALLGSGSEVLGYDTPLSMDHHWGPKLQLFLTSMDYNIYKEAVIRTLRDKLPTEISGISTNFGPPDEIGVQLLEKVEKGPVNHLVYVNNIDTYFIQKIGIDPSKKISAKQWINTPEQKLLEVTSGKVFDDGLHQLEALRQKISFYPHDIWLYKLAHQWQAIADEEAFVGRCGDVGDEIGSKIIASRIVESLMRLCFLYEKTYAPYSKWFGTAFLKLPSASSLLPALQATLDAKNWKEREHALSQGYEIVAKIHNQSNITSPIETKVAHYHNRPYLVIHADRIANAIRNKIEYKDGLSF